ncbi:MAG: exodeoxyribonuclease VII large subunit [Aquamicrobium sp.]|uniref:exodeoxyribonuclease VII large subunit n=1 Tax=Aquamicrobium sp. TaxID=1872579 RepID=UPI00349E56E6|nr:exodeoxyribonuclease VII large subunit [Aquamicrobium sp.]
MSDPFFDTDSRAVTPSVTNAAEFTVSELSGALKRTVEDAFGNVRVRGEISGYRGPHSSGHAYFALKDERARLEAVIWKGTFSRLKFRPEEGMEVIASGKLTTYPGSSKYQIVIDNLEPAGAGALMALLEERRSRLAAEGLFDAERKQLLPFMPRVIGVVTSPTGAVIRDIVHRISDRFPLHVVVWPVRVQGETAGAEVAAAVDGFNALDPLGPVPVPDVLIVARGGGSLEDLWGFNDEAVVRAVAASHIPVISAVGHETDWTLIDHAADLRAPTPTGAAELAVPVKADLEAALARLAARLRGCMSRHGERKREALRAVSRALPSIDDLLAMPRRDFDEAASRLSRALAASTEAKRLRFRGLRLSPALLERRLAEARTRLARDAGRVSPEALRRRIELHGDALERLGRRADQSIAIARERRTMRLAQAWRLAETLSHRSVLRRGFALVRDAQGLPVKSAAAVGPGDALAIEFADGSIDAVASGGESARPVTRKQARKPEGGGQGSLF